MRMASLYKFPVLNIDAMYLDAIVFGSFSFFRFSFWLTRDFAFRSIETLRLRTQNASFSQLNDFQIGRPLNVAVSVYV